MEQDGGGPEEEEELNKMTTGSIALWPRSPLVLIAMH